MVNWSRAVAQLGQLNGPSDCTGARVVRALRGRPARRQLGDGQINAYRSGNGGWHHRRHAALDATMRQASSIHELGGAEVGNADATRYTAPSGAMVFASGSNTVRLGPRRLQTQPRAGPRVRQPPPPTLHAQCLQRNDAMTTSSQSGRPPRSTGHRLSDAYGQAGALRIAIVSVRSYVLFGWVTGFSLTGMFTVTPWSRPLEQGASDQMLPPVMAP